MYTEESSDFLGHFLSGIPSTGGPARTPTGLGTPWEMPAQPREGAGWGRSGVDQGLRRGWKSWGDAGSPSLYREGPHVLSRCVSGGGVTADPLGSSCISTGAPQQGTDFKFNFLEPH